MNINRPTLLLNKEQVIPNIRKMAAKATRHDLFFRPHFKTHQSRMIGEWFREEGVTGITVSSVAMAEYFQEAGWQDITIAFPCNIREYEKIDQLAGKCDLKILVVNTEAVQFLKEKLKNRLFFLIEIDNGYHRTGLDTEDQVGIDKILAVIGKCDLIKFKGFLTHAGNSYHAHDLEEIKNIHRNTLDQLHNLKAKYKGAFPDMIISLGDTPCCSLLDDFDGVDEIRPGNFVFYDLMQEQIGSCRMEEIAVALACPVVAKNENRLEIAVYGGAIHLSKEYILDKAGSKQYGRIVQLNDNGWSAPVPKASVISLSQEHGIIKTEKEFFDQILVGDVIGILPVHSCLTADAIGEYLTLEGEKIDHY